MVKIVAFLFSICLLVQLASCRLSHANAFGAGDSHRADSIMAVADRFLNTDVDSALACSNLALSFYRSSSNNIGEANALLMIGIIESIKGEKGKALNRFDVLNQSQAAQNNYRFKCKTLLEIGKLYYDWGQYDSSLVFFTKSNDVASANLDSALQAQSVYQMGKYFHTTGQYNQSIDHYNKASSLIYGASQKRLQISLLLSSGKCFLRQGQLQEALANYQKAFAMSVDYPDKISKAEACNHLGSIYLVLGQLPLSLQYHKQALVYRQQMQNANGLVKSHNNIGETFLALNRSDSALFHFNRALDISNRLQYHKGTVKALTNIATTYSLNPSFGNALTSLQKALQMALESGYKEGITEAYCTLGAYYALQNNSIDALDNYNKALVFASEVSRIDFIIKCYQGIYASNKQLGDDRKALGALERASALQLQQLETEKTNQLAEMQILFESEKKERENQLLKQQNNLNAIIIQRKNNLLVVSLVALAFLLVIVLLVYARFKNKKRSHFAMQILNSQLELAIGERDKLLSIIAHELRNPLFWFQNLTQTLSQKFRAMPDNKIEKSLISLDESAKNAFHLMDNLLNWSRSKLNRITPKRVPIELSIVVEQNLRLFQSIVLHKRIQLVSSCNNGVFVLVDVDLLDTVLRNLISNAIKFTPEDGIISIDCQVVDSFVHLEIADSGQGLSPQLKHAFNNNEAVTVGQGLLNEKGSGFGLRICHEFITLIDGRLGISDSKHGGACFWITVPLADKPLLSKTHQTLSYSN